jgi:murein DD-endopeptidase MepM/ murein hydrolase activator NlpD
MTQDIIKAPSLFGLVKPVVLLGEHINEMSDEHIRYLLLHELLHYKRRDMVLNALLIVLQSVYWFNPVVWFCLCKIREDMEQANDQATLGYVPSAEHIDYANALLSVLRRASLLSSPLLSAASRKKIMTRRIQMIKLNASLNRRKWLVSTLCIILAASLGAVLLTGAKEKPVEPQQLGKPIEPQRIVIASAEKPSSPETGGPTGSDSDGEFLWPVTDYDQNAARYGMHMHPIKKIEEFHDVIDIPAPEGTPVLAAKKGTIAEKGYDEANGNYVIVRHGDGFQTYYYHMFGFAEGLSNGDIVLQGDAIGYVGTTGESTGNHLHFGLSIGDEYVDPMSVFAPKD